MVLVEILANSWGTYRMGFTNSVQHADFGSSILFSLCMVALLPENAQPRLAPMPQADELKNDYKIKNRQWEWVLESQPRVETAISKWVHANMSRI